MTEKLILKIVLHNFLKVQDLITYAEDQLKKRLKKEKLLDNHLKEENILHLDLILKKDEPYIIAPEDNLAWENFPNDKNRFLIPVLNDSQLEKLKMLSKIIANAEKNKKAFDKKIKNEVNELIAQNNTNDENLKSAMDIDKKIKFREVITLVIGSLCSQNLMTLEEMVLYIMYLKRIHIQG